MNIDYDGLRDRYASDIACAEAEEARVLVDAMKDEEIASFALRFVWAICDYCHGDGGHSRRFGAYTSEDWDELDEEFQEDYLSGRFDATCEVCHGSGKVRELDEDCLTDEAREYLAAYRQNAYDDAMCSYYERLAGC